MKTLTDFLRIAISLFGKIIENYIAFSEKTQKNMDIINIKIM